jgi:NitT/TauT family transport system substrate-binding protein
MTIRGRRSIFAALVLAVLLAGMAAAAALFRPPAQLESLRLGAYDGDVGALEWIALDKGFFMEAGVQVALTGFPSGNAAVDALRAGQVDVATAADLVVAKRSFDEPDLRILADICRYWNKGLVARKDRGITTLADLKGRRIGVPVTSTAEHNLVVLLAMQGLTTSDVTVIDLAPAALVDGLATGSIDAAIVWQPHVLAMQRRLGDNAVTLMDGGTEANLLLVARDGDVAPRAEALRRLMRGLVLAQRWVDSHPAEAKAYLASRFKLAPAYIDILWPRMQLTVSLPQEILSAMDSEARWIANTGKRAAVPDFSNTIHAPILMSVDPALVHVFVR